MGLWDALRTLLAGNAVDLRKRFETLREATAGTMSRCYKARDLKTGQVVALKVLDAKKTAEFEARFKGLKKPPEGEIAMALDHPRVVRTFEHGRTTEGEFYVVMEYLEGATLSALIMRQSPELEGRRLNLLRQAAEALHYVHTAGYIHRDVCPRNLLVAPDYESLKLIDFGLTVPATRFYLQGGNRTGTPNYMAPELVLRQPTDQRLDVFAFGVTAYETCTFQLPWDRGRTGMAAMQHANKPAIDIRDYRPQLHPKLAEAIAACIEPNPNDRCPSLAHFLKQIQGLTHEDA